MITRKESNNKLQIGLFKSMQVKKSDKDLIDTLNKNLEKSDEKDIIQKCEEDKIQPKN